MSTPTLFDLEPRPSRKPIQSVNDERDRMIAAVARKAQQRRARFVAEACVFVLSYLAASPGPVSGETLTLACKATGIVPHDDRAFGAVYMRLSRTGKIHRAGAVRRERGHGTSGGILWRLTRNANCAEGING